MRQGVLIGICILLAAWVAGQRWTIFRQAQIIEHDQRSATIPDLESQIHQWQHLVGVLESHIGDLYAIGYSQALLDMGQFDGKFCVLGEQGIDQPYMQLMHNTIFHVGRYGVYVTGEAHHMTISHCSIYGMRPDFLRGNARTLTIGQP